jgi:hypothetical protein
MNKWKESLSILIIGSSFIALILFIQPTNQNQYFYTEIPKSTISHYLINSSDLVKKLVYNELFVHKDDVLVEKIKEQLSKETDSENNFLDLSLNISDPIEIIRFQKDNRYYTAIKFKIDNIQVFDENNSKMRNQLIFRNKTNAYWVFSQPKNKTTQFKEFMNSSAFKFRIKNEHSKQFLSVFQNSKLISQSTVEINGSSILIVKKQNKISKYHNRLLPKGFNLSTLISLSDLTSFKNEKVFNIVRAHELNYVSLNYNGLNFIDNDKLPLMPNFEIYLSYKNTICGDSIVQRMIEHFNLPFKNDSPNTYSCNEETIYVKQIDTNQIIVSSMKTEFRLGKTKLNPILSGDPKMLIKVTNAGWKGLFLELIPGFNASKKFLESTNKVSTYFNRNGEQVICISLKTNKDPLHSILKFGLSLQ